MSYESEAISVERYKEIKEIFRTLDRISETAQDLKNAIHERAYDQTLADIKYFDSVQDYVREMHSLTMSTLEKLEFELNWLD